MKLKKREWILGAVSLTLFALILIGYKTNGGRPEPVELPRQDTVVVPKTGRYGLPLADYKTDSGLIKPNQNLSDLLARRGVPTETIHVINQHFEGVFDVRTMRVGQPYTFFMDEDSTQLLKYLVYEHNPIEYVVVDFENDYRVTKGVKPTEWKQKEVKGKVESSLWVALQQQQTSPMLAMLMSDIFGWTIDFFDLKKEDEFRILYEQQFVDSIPLPKFRICAASYQQEDSLYYAIPFTQDNEELYYNERGNSLEGAFLKAPLDFYRITSRFTNRRFHPVLKRYRAHHGVDYAAPTGTPVYSIGSGKVISVGWAGGGGNTVKIRHNDTYVTSYMHLSRYAKGLKVGQAVKQKEVIGYVGSTGLSTGPHLDFRVYERGKPINPLTIKSQPKKPISQENKEAFGVVCDSLKKVLTAM